MTFFCNDCCPHFEEFSNLQLSLPRDVSHSQQQAVTQFSRWVLCRNIGEADRKNENRSQYQFNENGFPVLTFALFARA